VTDNETEAQMVARFVHRVEHLRWRKGLGALPEHEWIAECWMPGHAPEWARELAASGAPGSSWCPQIKPALTDTQN
jgi:hypothetical protein